MKLECEKKVPNFSKGDFFFNLILIKTIKIDETIKNNYNYKKYFITKNQK